MTAHLNPAHQQMTAAKVLVPFGHQSDADMNEGCLAALKAIGTISRFGRNETIFAEGDPANYSFKIMSGAVRLYKLLPDGRRQIAEFRLAGDFFGMEATSEYALTAEALCDAVVVRYARNRLDRLEDEQATLRRDLLNLLRRDLTAAQTHLIMLGRQTAKERIASFLVQLAERQNVVDNGSVEVPMGRQDMADYLGLTIETVCRAISDLKRARIIGIPDRHHIVVKSMDALQAVADGEN